MMMCGKSLSSPTGITLVAAGAVVVSFIASASCRWETMADALIAPVDVPRAIADRIDLIARARCD
jgi:hypothetical protein